MVRRIIKTGVEARQALAEGARKMAEGVGRTLGPWGENFFLDKRNTITNDGVTVAREIQLSDEVENRGATAIREAAIKTVEEVGDGTTTAVLLANEIYKEAARLLPKEGVTGKKTSAEIVRQIEKERKEIDQRLIEMATPVETEEQLIQSAIVSTEDPDLGKLIAHTQWKLGKDAYLMAEETAERQSSAEVVEGIRIDNGFGTSQLVNDQERQELKVEDTKVLLTSWSIRTAKDWEKLLKIYEQVFKAGNQRLVIIARAWTDECIQFALRNIQQGASIYPLNAPYVDMQEKFKDLAAVTGATFYDSENSTLEDINLSGLGFSPKVIGRRYDAIVTGTNDGLTNERITKRVGELEAKHTGSKSDFEKEGLSSRIAQLKNGFGIIKVGSPSDMERKRLFDKAEDAVHAVRAAYQEGTVPGAGLAFKQISDSLPDDYILKRPIRIIYEQIMSSAPEGFEISNDVRDPLKVLRVALEKACAVAGSFSTAAGVITQEFPKQLDEIMRNPQSVQNEG